MTKRNKREILLIHDAGPTARAIVDSLTADGLEVTAVENVYEAVSLFTRRPADLVLLGIAELDDRELEVIRVFRDLHRPVCLLTLFPIARRDRAVKALALGADSYILEPFYTGELLDMVRRGLRRAGDETTGPAPAEPSEDLTRLAGAVAHSINNPLQIIELLLSEATESLPDPQEFRQETARVGEVVEELLGFSRRFDFRPGPLDLNELLRDIVAGPERGRRGVRLALRKEVPEIIGDERALRQLFRALSGMARARDAEGRLFVSSRLTEDGNRVAVRLRAPDLLLTSEEHDSFFASFGSPVPGAVGLAMATAQAVLEAHGADVEVQSRQGEGTTVRVILPVTGPEATGEEKREDR